MTAATGQLAVAIAERLIDAVAVADSIETQDRGSLSGLAGTALLHARLSTVSDLFAAAAIEHWNRAAAHARHTGATGSGTFSGPGSVAASLILGAPYLPDPQQVHRQAAAAARWLSAHAVAIATDQHDQLEAGLPPSSWAVYDSICGLAGIGRVLLSAVDQGHRHASVGLDAALITLSTMTNNRNGNRPGWWLAADAHPAATHMHRSGAADTGMAHGIAGPLSLLAIAYTAGHHVPGQDKAIRVAADWLLRSHSPASDTWPTHITGDELDHNTAAPARGRHDAWCYGTPGISAALTHATDALHDEAYRARADQAMQKLAARDPCSWDVDGPTLCHGYAGVLQSSRRHPALASHAAAQIHALAAPRHRYLVEHTDRGATADDPGLLTGAAGVALALADHAELPSSARSHRWDDILLLS